MQVWWSVCKKGYKTQSLKCFLRELIVHMTSYGVKPSKNFSSTIARKIVFKYPFLREAVGGGYVNICNCVLNVVTISNSVQASWEKCLIGRVYVSKGEKKTTEWGRRSITSGKEVTKTLDNYPPLSLSDITDESTRVPHEGYKGWAGKR